MSDNERFYWLSIYLVYLGVFLGSIHSSLRTGDFGYIVAIGIAALIVGVILALRLAYLAGLRRGVDASHENE